MLRICLFKQTIYIRSLFRMIVNMPEKIDKTYPIEIGERNNSIIATKATVELYPFKSKQAEIKTPKGPNITSNIIQTILTFKAITGQPNQLNIITNKSIITSMILYHLQSFHDVQYEL